MRHNKGKCTYTEAVNMSNKMFHSLYAKLIHRLSTEAGQQEEAEEQLKETIEEEVLV